MDGLTPECAFQLSSISKRYNKHVTNMAFSVHAVSYSTLHLFNSHKLLVEKIMVHNLGYGPQTWLVRGIYNQG